MWAAQELHRLGTGDRLTPKTSPSPHLLPHHTLSFCVKGCIPYIDRRERKKIGERWASLRVGAWLTPGNIPLPTCYPVEFSRSRSNGASAMKEIPLKNLTPRVLPFKVSSRGNRNRHRSIGCL